MRTDAERDLLYALAGADPLTTTTDEQLHEHLQRARRIVDLRRAEVAPRARRRRRWRAVAVATAVAATMPVAAVIVVPDVVRQTGLPWVTDLTGSANAENGMIPGLSCGGGYGTAIRPDSAPVRLWPTELPAGWEVERVFATKDREWGWCTPPSLVLAQTGPDGVVTATVNVVGPNRDIQWSGGPKLVPDRIAGHPADEVRSGMGVKEFHRWVVRTGENEWEVTVNGLARAEAKAAADGLLFDDTLVSWQGDSTTAPFETVHRRSDPQPYPNRVWDGLEWTVVLRDPAGRERHLSVEREPVGWRSGLASALHVGARQVSLDGRPALVNTRAAASVTIEVMPNVAAFMNVRGDQDAVEQILASLENLPADDPRLDEYALNERYED